MSERLVTPISAPATTRSRAVYDSVPQPKSEARLADHVRYISTPFISIGATLTPNLFDLFVVGPVVSLVGHECVLALSHALTAGQETAKLFADVRENAGASSFEPPSYSAIARAADWVRNLERSTSEWNPPHVSSSPGGEIVLEWWRDPRKLTVYISDSGTEFVKSWGTSVRDEMAEGTATSVEEAQAIWNWLIRG